METISISFEKKTGVRIFESENKELDQLLRNEPYSMVPMNEKPLKRCIGGTEQLYTAGDVKLYHLTQKNSIGGQSTNMFIAIIKAMDNIEALIEDITTHHEQRGYKTGQLMKY